MVQLRLATKKQDKTNIPFLLRDFQEEEKEDIQFRVEQRHFFTKEDEVASISGLGENTWLLPTRWNQGGFDAVQLLPNNAVRFVQITRGASHSLKWKYHFMILENLQKANYNVSSFEIAFILSADADQNTFKVSPNPGLPPKKFADKLQKQANGQYYYLYGLKRNNKL